MPNLPVGFMHGNEVDLPQQVQNGNFLWTDDTGKFYLDINSDRYYLNHPRVYSNTKAVWDAQRELVGEKDVIYVYTDGSSYTDGNNQTVYLPAIKIGDGQAFLIDSPFVVDGRLIDHISNTSIHVTPAEKEFWNNKVSIDESQVGNGKIIFKTN